MASIFSKIISGEIQSYKIFEDNFTVSFLDINPINPGHVIVVPKLEVDQIWQVPEPYYAKIFENSKIISQAISKSTKCLRVCTWTEGFEIPHAHYHICPFFNTEGEFWSKKSMIQSDQELKKMQQTIISNL
jgi:histidine triad (HIT) family protein